MDERDTTDEPPRDPADALAIIAAAGDRGRTAYPSGAYLFLLWGAVWLVGYGLLWLSTQDGEGRGTPSLLAALAAIGLGAVGLGATVWHVVRRSRGVAGTSARTGALYGWSWPVAFVAQALIVTSLGQAGASPEVTSLAGNALAALVVGVLYLAGGALWEDLPMFFLGGWIALVGAASALVGLPGTYLAMSLAGGGGMLVAGAYSAVQERWAARA